MLFTPYPTVFNTHVTTRFVVRDGRGARRFRRRTWTGRALAVTPGATA
ncbi:MAG TPA: hypothetical protein VK846_13145 [Candidatus Limnocylindria bacterium]|nr:hypothetical protein [Candidatus Limnocylindria bacterium]